MKLCDSVQGVVARFPAWSMGVACLLLAFGFSPVSAGQVQFSADTLQQPPQGATEKGKIYVGAERVRTELNHNGTQIVQIIDRKAGISWVLYPETRSYIEYRQPARSNPPQEGGASPCSGIPGAQCTRLGEQAIAGRDAVKWRITYSRDGQSYESTEWIDKERGLVLQHRDAYQSSTMKLLSRESLQGRSVEKWEMTLRRGQQPEQRLYRWFDPELGLALREELPGGLVREMSNIKLAPQDPGLFSVPSGFQRIEPSVPGKR